MTIREAYDNARSALAESGIEEADCDARLLLEYAAGITRHDLLLNPETELDAEAAGRFELFLSKRCSRIPLQHIVGSCGFMGFDFAVRPNVLIPRPDTEILVEEALRELHDGMRVLDLCTGSGCILISLLALTNGCEGVGIDVSEDALALARENADAVLVREGADKAVFAHADLLAISDEEFVEAFGKYEVIVSNPPYIRRTDIDTLSPEVRDHDPILALDGGEDGLIFYRRITQLAKVALKGGGALLYEIGCDQAADVSAIMETAGFKEIRTVKDYAGLDRVVCGIWE